MTKQPKDNDKRAQTLNESGKWTISNFKRKVTISRKNKDAENKPFSNSLQFCQFPTEFLQHESFTILGIIRVFFVNANSMEHLTTRCVCTQSKHFVWMHIFDQASSLVWAMATVSKGCDTNRWSTKKRI